MVTHARKRYALAATVNARIRACFMLASDDPALAAEGRKLYDRAIRIAAEWRHNAARRTERTKNYAVAA